MFYYAEIDGEYLVINTYGLTEPSTNPNYVSITEEQYTSGDLVGKYYNTLRGQFEIIDWDEWVGSSNLFTHFNTEMNCNTEMQLSTKIDNMQAEINSKVGANHTHDGYATADHTHNGYAMSNHTHDGYATQVALDTLADEVDGKANANHSHIDYALTSHTHNEYAEVGHSHSNYAVTTHNHDEDYSPLSHSHNYNDLTNKPTIPSIDGLATEDYVDEKVATVTVESIGALPNTTVIPTVPTNVSAFTNDVGYLTEHQSLDGLATETYVDEAVTTKANNTFASAKTYTDSAVETAKNDLLNGAGTAYDTLKELGDLIDDNADAIEALEIIASGKANASHTHAISDVTGLQTALDCKAASSHGAHVTYSSTAPVMDGTASVGTASAVARSDHKHPTDTSRAAQTDLDTHTSNKSNPHGVTLAQLGVNATTTELNYMDGVTSNVQTQLDGKANSSHNHSASNITSGTLSSDRLPIVPISNGGTGASTRATAFANLISLGTNPITSTDNDTVANWCTLGNGYAWYTTTEQLIDQPNQWGFLLNFVRGSDVWQIWKTQSGGSMYFRSGNSSGWAMTWREIIDSSTIGSKSVNYATSAESATSANKLTTARTISLTGDVAGSTSFDGSGNVSITTTVADDSHNHTITNIDNLQNALNNKMEKTPISIELNQSGSLQGYGGFIDFHYYDANGNASANTDYSSRIIESDDGVISINDVTFGRSGKTVTATTFNGTTFSGSGVATVSEVETYLGI